MIRRDYLLRQIEQFVAMLAKITGLAKNEQWQEASTVTAGEFQRLTGMDGPGSAADVRDGVAGPVDPGEPTLVVESKAFMLATLLKTNGDLIASQGRLEESRQYYLKGLHLLLDTFGRNEITERPDFVPAVEAFLTGLRDAPLPVKTNARLMRHHERTGEFAKAEDALFGMVDAGPDDIELLDFGRLFYQRLLGLGDDTLMAGNLPRAEVEAGLAELDARQARLRRTAG